MIFSTRGVDGMGRVGGCVEGGIQPFWKIIVLCSTSQLLILVQISIFQQMTSKYVATVDKSFYKE